MSCREELVSVSYCSLSERVVGARPCELKGRARQRGL